MRTLRAQSRLRSDHGLDSRIDRQQCDEYLTPSPNIHHGPVSERPEDCARFPPACLSPWCRPQGWGDVLDAYKGFQELFLTGRRATWSSSGSASSSSS